MPLDRLCVGRGRRAHVILVPEKEIDIDHVCALLKYNYDHGKRYGVVVVAEGCHLPEVGQVMGSAQVDSFGHARLSGIGEALAELIEKKTGFETRSVNLGHTQRGGVPTPMTACWGSGMACTPSTWCTSRSGAASPCCKAPTSPISPSRRRSPPTASWMIVSLA